ncbi:MAG TPA: hypothetical protein V6D22_10210 [Candidatus Obscuribacterales bacterium]
MTSATLKLNQQPSVSATHAKLVIRKATSELAYALLMLSPIIALVALMFCTSHINMYLLRCIALVAIVAYVVSKPVGAAINHAIEQAKSRPAKPVPAVASAAEPVAAETIVVTKVEAEIVTKVEAEPELVNAA